MNEDVVDKLGVKVEKELMTVKLANNKQISSTPLAFDIGLESVEERVDAAIVAQTLQRFVVG